VRGYALVNCVYVGPIGMTNIDVKIFEPKARIDIRGDLVVGFDDVFDVHINKVIERVDVLFNKALHFKEGRQ
jgi:hypothetical protein